MDWHTIYNLERDMSFLFWHVSGRKGSHIVRCVFWHWTLHIDYHGLYRLANVLTCGMKQPNWHLFGHLCSDSCSNNCMGTHTVTFPPCNVALVLTYVLTRVMMSLDAVCYTSWPCYRIQVSIGCGSRVSDAEWYHPAVHRSDVQLSKQH